MNLPTSASPWQPLTFGGVAAFAHGSSTRLWKVQSLAALVVTGCLLAFALLGLAPTLERAVLELPETAAIRSGRLQWPDAEPVTLAADAVLSLHVDPVAARPAGSGADFQLVLGPTQARVDSWFGYAQVPYPTGYVLHLGRDPADAWWRAWQPVFVIGFCAAMFLGLVLCWWLLALAYAVPVRTISHWIGRGLSFAEAWRLANAALLPGALLAALAVLFYGLHRLPFAGLVLAWLLHVVVGWVYVLVAPLRLPRRPAPVSAGRRNPFGSGPAESGSRSSRSANPFSGRPAGP